MAVVFLADDGQLGQELWIGGLTTGAPRMIADIAPGEGWLEDPRLVPLGGKAVLTQIKGNVLDFWWTDGTAEGTARIGELALRSSTPGQIGVVLDRYLTVSLNEDTAHVFGAESFLIDGASRTLEGVIDLTTRQSWGADRFTQFADRFVFAATYERNDDSRLALIVSDGQIANRTVISPAELMDYGGPNAIAALGDAGFVFLAGSQLWTSDGTVAGTHEIMQAGSAYGWATGAMTGFGGKTVFGVDDQKDRSTHALWVTDGTREGTWLIDSFATQPFGSKIEFVAAAGDKVFFTAEDATRGTGLWVTDGTRDGTQFLNATDVSSSAGSFAVLGDKLIFRGGSVSHPDVWVSDGTVAGTHVLKDIRPDIGSFPAHFTVAGNRVVFSAYDANHGNEPWITDGTSEGTRLLGDIASSHPSSGSNPAQFVYINSAPTSIALEARTAGAFAYNAWAIAGTLSAADPDAGDTHRFGMLDGANGVFTVRGNTVFQAGEAEPGSVHTVTVRAFDQAGAFIDRSFEVVAGSGPLEALLANGRVLENAAAGTVAGVLTSDDPGASFALLDTSGKFSIENGNLVVAEGAAFDYETNSFHRVAIRTTLTDGTAIDRLFTVYIDNVSEAPDGIALGNSTVSEFARAGTAVGRVAAIHGEGPGPYTYTLADSAGGLFALDGDMLVVAAGASFDAEATFFYTVMVTASTATGEALTRSFNIFVEDENEAPTTITLSNARVTGGANAWTFIGSLGALDPDIRDTHTFTLIDDAGGRFALGSDGDGRYEIDVGGTKLPDSSAAASHTIVVRATDARGAWVDKEIVIEVAAGNKAPSGLTLSGGGIAENAARGTAVGTLSATDADADDSHTFWLGDNAGGRFALQGNTIVVADRTLLDFEQGASHTITVRATDTGGLFKDETFTILVSNSAPEAVFGDARANTFVSGDGDDTLNGGGGGDALMSGAGDDVLFGGDGEDTLFGGADNDRLFGGAGADVLDGGAGSDGYWIDAGDRVIETALSGEADHVHSAIISLDLRALGGGFVEHASLMGSAALSLTGNGARNVLAGNEGANTISGGAGADILTGGAGADRFVFDARLITGNADRIADFTAADGDRICLDNSIFTRAGLDGGLRASGFVNGARAQDRDDRVLYDSKTGALFYDADGTGAAAAIKFAVLAGKPAISAADFLVI